MTTTDLARHIQQTRLADTHEHLRKEEQFLHEGPDVLQDLFGSYVQADLVVAGASPEAVQRLLDASNPDLAARFEPVREAWERCQHTGYGEAVRLVAKLGYRMDEINARTIEAARVRNAKMKQPGERLRILRDEANLDHVQTDDFVWACLPDYSGLDFFLYDLSWRSFARCELSAEAIHKEVGVTVRDLRSLREAMTAIFARYAPCAIAVKSQHAYSRSLRWRERSDAEAEPVLQKTLAGKPLTEEETACLGDWCLARGVELAIEHNLPFKIHTGYYAGHGTMAVERIPAGHLCGLLRQYPKARFVLMHIAYPYSDELVAVAKHFPNVYVDLCWAWGIDPYSACDFVRRMIHAVPANKLFAFGGDTNWPNSVLAYSVQARQWLTRALQAEVDDGLLTEPQAIALATRLMRTNQEQCFDLQGTRAAIRAAASQAVAA
jgi:hypothetical protein